MKKILIVSIVCVVVIIVYTLSRSNEMVIDNASGTQTNTQINDTQQINTPKAKPPQKTTNTAPSNTDQTNAVTITYTNAGFSPKTVQIAKGTKVTFVNKSSKPMMIVADDATNPKYVELNQPRSIGNGGIYTFNFVYAGVWAYHNELVKEHKANIVVY